MIAKQLERILAHETANIDFQGRSTSDLVQRFQSLRSVGALPKGRGKNAQHLNISEIVAGLLSIISDKPGYAGFGAKLLMSLRPVGGIYASFFKANTFSHALIMILEEQEKLDTVIEIRVSGSEIYTNGYGRASITYRANDGLRTAYFISKMATSLMVEGAEETYSPEQLISSTIQETVFFHSLFEKIHSAYKVQYPDNAFDHLIDPDEEEVEKLKKERIKCLGISSNSNFLNLAIDTQVTWPREETVVEFQGKKLILLPSTKNTDTSIHIDLFGQGMSHHEAHSLINRFLSLLTWRDDQFCTAQGGGSGSRIPVPTNKRNLGFVTAPIWHQYCDHPDNEDVYTALALYRQGRNAEQNFLVPYAVLSYYKIIEIRYKGKSPKKWFKDNYPVFRKLTKVSTRIERFEDACGSQSPHEYIYKTCRVAVAHVYNDLPSDPDDFDELRRLHVAADVLRGLARYFIQTELGYSCRQS